MKVMRCTGLFFCALILIVILSVCMGCTSGPAGQNQSVPNNTTVVNEGLVPLTGYSYHAQTFTFDDAVNGITYGYQRQDNTSPGNPAIYHIHGQNVDSSGKAEHWLFGIREGNTTSMISYDANGVSQYLWRQWLPEQEINVQNLRPPETILKVAYPENQNITGLELEIGNGNYTITAPQGMHPRGYIINATTGVLIATQE